MSEPCTQAFGEDYDIDAKGRRSLGTEKRNKAKTEELLVLMVKMIIAPKGFVWEELIV